MTEAVHYIEPTPLAFDSICVYNDKDHRIAVEFRLGGKAIHTQRVPGHFGETDRLHLTMKGSVTFSYDA